MKVLFTCIIVFSLTVSNGRAANVPPVNLPNAKQIMLPIGNTGNIISLMDLAHIDVANFQTLTGKKLSFFDKISFSISQRKLRNIIAVDGSIKRSFAKKLTGGTTGFHGGGFALGFLLGLIGVLITYLRTDGEKSNRVKWAWVGLGASIAFFVLLVVVLL